MTYAHSSVYMEKKAEAGKPTVFSEEFAFDAYGAWFDLDTASVKPYDTTTSCIKPIPLSATATLSLRHRYVRWPSVSPLGLPRRWPRLAASLND